MIRSFVIYSYNLLIDGLVPLFFFHVNNNINFVRQTEGIWASASILF
jgi:hypothetical protein